jgi:predicted TIM-barrel fold metal-dependent hydrolase
VDALDLFDCNCGLGPSRRHRPGLITDPAQLQAELDVQGISRALVYAISAEEYFPRHGNRWLLEQIGGSDRLLPCWIVMPHHTGEFPAPDKLMGRMREHGVRAARMNPPSHNRYSIAPWSAGALLKTLERHRIPLFLSGTDLGRYLDDPGTGFSPEVIHELCHTYPLLPIVILRLNFQLTRVAVALLQSCPNLYADLSYHDVFLGIELLCREVGAERLLFGTGLPIGGRGAALVTLQAAEIEEGERHRIAGANLQRLLDGVQW